MPEDLPGEVLPPAAKTKLGKPRQRKLKPCGRCDGPRELNIWGSVNGKPMALCPACKAHPRAKGKAPLFLQREYRHAAEAPA